MLHVRRGPPLALALALALPPTALAADAAAEMSRTRAARSALAGDPELGPLNLGVTVRGDAAKVWGPVPSRELARLAVERVRAATGLSDVSDESHLPTPAPGRPPRPPVPPVTLPSDEMPAAPVPEAPESAPALVGPAPGPAVLPATVSDVSSFRGPARATAPAAVPTAGGPTPALTASVPEAETLTVLAERVRRTDRRWSSLAVSAEDGFVRLGGVAGTWSSVWDLADGLRRLPGVRGVRVDGVRIDASRADR